MEPSPLREERAGALVTAALAGLAAAVAGGVAWGLIVKWTEYEVGFVAWGVGLLVGLAVVAGAGGSRGLPLQVLAVVLALVGIVIGKYLAFVWAIQALAEEEGIEIDLPVFSGSTVDEFLAARGEVWSLFDLLWIGLAVVTAFRMPASVAPEPAAEGPES